MIQSRLLTLTQANVDNGHMYLTECMSIFPKDTLGGTNESQAAPRKVQIKFGGAVATTDIDQGKRIFRSRCFRRFFSENSLAAGDRVLLEQLEAYKYRLSKADDYMPLRCLSIQQPWADLILACKKKVENRSGPWNDAAPLLDAGGRVLLAIHASKSLTIWPKLKPQQQEALAPGWCRGDSLVGLVIGVVDVVRICGYEELGGLKNHKYVFKEEYEWFWVLENPRRLIAPFEWTGNVSLLHVPVPCRLLPEDLR